MSIIAVGTILRSANKSITSFRAQVLIVVQQHRHSRQIRLRLWVNFTQLSRVLISEAHVCPPKSPRPPPTMLFAVSDTPSSLFSRTQCQLK